MARMLCFHDYGCGRIQITTEWLIPASSTHSHHKTSKSWNLILRNRNVLISLEMSFGIEQKSKTLKRAKLRGGPGTSFSHTTDLQTLVLQELHRCLSQVGSSWCLDHKWL